MANGTWKRSTAASRRAERKIRYAHTSVLVSVNKDPETGMLVPTRTPKGEGSTAKRAQPKQPSKRDRLRFNPIGHDWAGKYLGRLASVGEIYAISEELRSGALASISEESANLAKEALARTLRKGWVSQVARSVSKLTD